MLRFLYLALLILCVAVSACSDNRSERPANDPRIDSLEVLSIESLRSRSYGSSIKVEQTVSRKAWPSYLASYQSDGLRVYARIDVPNTAPPDNGFPVVVLVHGWLGIDAAPNTDFFYDPTSTYSAVIDAYVDAGLVVFVPGWRGHGTVNGQPAEGIEYMQAWDNGSYLSPVFYTIDVLNLLDSLNSFDLAPLDLEAINLYGHSQGGDVALMTLAIAGEDSSVTNNISAATIWSGNIPSRMTQLETFWPMQTSPQAFISGDNTWNGTAIGDDGSVNPAFVFGFPADWIGTPHQDEWTWQIDNWNNATVVDALEVKLEQMYGAIRANVGDLADATYQIENGTNGKPTIIHDPRVLCAMREIGGFRQHAFLTEPLALHHSDRDFYSFPSWNADLCRRINSATGQCFDFTYTGNTHSLDVSEHTWFSPQGTSAGFPIAIKRDIALFAGQNPAEIQAE